MCLPTGLICRCAGWVAAVGAVLGIAVAVRGSQVPTTLNDFFGPGTQPNQLQEPIETVQVCAGCHGFYDPQIEPVNLWAPSMMALALRDPVFQAALTIAEQDAAFVGDLCIRCHSPGGWLEGRSVPTDGSALTGKDFEGVACNVCHRLVDPVYEPGVSPMRDQQILNNLNDPPVNFHSAHYVIDPMDFRRGPFDLGPGFTIHRWLQSPFHQEAALCGTCHDVSNPAFTRQPDGTYALNDLDTPHPTHDKYDQFPVERTYSEWLMSDFALGPVDVGGRFGGNLPAVSTCQDCHMPPTTGLGCFFGQVRQHMPRHEFNGGNTWVPRAVRVLYDDSETLLNDQNVADAIDRAIYMLQNASDLELTATGPELNVRIINQTGHKLPTGYPEGRRMWINVKFFDPNDALIAEHGAYDPNTAVLDESTTKVYEAKLGVDAAVSALTGIPEGPSFHFAVNNVYYKDNRIPPRGFTNANFEAVQAAPVGYSYADGQYWDDTQFVIPIQAVRAEVRVYYQTTSKEYIEFLRDENTTNNTGQIAYDLWEMFGKSAPVEMDFGTINVCPADLDGDGVAGLTDLALVLGNFGITGAAPTDGDFDGDGDVDLIDLSSLLGVFGTVCP